ncbi:CvfB family protein [Desulfamplus magnetovallimortis]|nr:S1-like domain-containing RNA-binding protein [Desulfamplus magnetovallimortis]
MLIIGSYNELVVQRESTVGFYLNPKEEEVLLPFKYVPEGLKPGDTITVFVYTDSEDRPVATTLKPVAVVGEFAFMTVKDTASFGAFLDWGLEKDLLIPNSEMPSRFKKGEKHVVKVCLDEESDRVFATARIAQNCSRYMAGISEGQRVEALVYGITELGYQAVIDNSHCGMIYKNETFEKLALGDKISAYIHRIRDDSKIDLLLKKPGYASVSQSERKVMEILEGMGGFTSCHDKSSPEEIKKIFSMSKKEFKKTVGSLYKSRKIKILDNGIILT